MKELLALLFNAGFLCLLGFCSLKMLLELRRSKRALEEEARRALIDSIEEEKEELEELAWSPFD